MGGAGTLSMWTAWTRKWDGASLTKQVCKVGILICHWINRIERGNNVLYTTQVVHKSAQTQTRLFAFHGNVSSHIT